MVHNRHTSLQPFPQTISSIQMKKHMLEIENDEKNYRWQWLKLRFHWGKKYHPSSTPTKRKFQINHTIALC
jgi:hypothetical protein